ncbi:MAG: hypothetical protein Q4D16_09035 [Eubacteriales bacterium]|nr:hypothetical protein [Eubacteriales bacterium]
MKSGKKRNKIHVKRKPQVSLTPDKGTYVQRTHKDTLFRFIFRDKRKLLELYNAINGSSYEDTDSLVVTTLENVIYLGYKNDVSFLLDWVLCLVEHQSSWNPNIPIRGVLYFARLYKDFIERGGYNLYSTRQIPLPFPQYIIFYNGTDKNMEREVICLSDAFTVPESLNGELAVPALECRALVLNINYGKNQELLTKCKPLLDYSRFISYIRQNISKGNTAEEAVDMAVEQCLREDVLTDVLKANRKEVVGMFLDEFDDELYRKALMEEFKQEGREEGRKEGRIEGQEEGRKEGLREGLAEGSERISRLCRRLVQDNRMDELVRSVNDRDFQEELLKEYGL